MRGSQSDLMIIIAGDNFGIRLTFEKLPDLIDILFILEFFNHLIQVIRIRLIG